MKLFLSGLATKKSSIGNERDTAYNSFIGFHTPDNSKLINFKDFEYKDKGIDEKGDICVIQS